LETQVSDLPQQFATQYGLASILDTFNRAELPLSGPTEIGGLEWAARNLIIRERGVTKSTPENTGAAFLGAPLPDGIFELAVTFPTAPTSAALYFRMQDEGTFWRLVCSAEGLRLERSIGGDVTIASSS